MNNQAENNTEDAEDQEESARESAAEAPGALLKMALWFAEHDVRVVPCGPNKKALSRDWRSIATTDPGKVREYFDGTDNLLAIVPVDNEMAVLNVPYDKIGEKWVADLPPTHIASPPGGGHHIYFSTPKSFGPAAYYRGVRVISDGYVIVPPSPGWEIKDHCDPAPMPRGVESTLRSHSIPCRYLDEFLKHDFPPVRTMLGQWLLERGSSMLCGRAGLGKTWSSLGIAIALAAGTEFLGWKAKGGPRRVLYVDGEMPAEKMQERYLTMLAALAPAQRVLALRNIKVISHVDAAGGIPSLGDAGSGGRELIEAWAEDYGADLIILDNLSALATVAGKSENDDTCWQDIRDWISSLMRRGHAVLIIHHTGKPNPLTGETRQRGTSKREDGLDSSIILERKGNGGPVTWSFTKNRHNDGTDPGKLTIALDGNCWFAPVEPDAAAEQSDPLEEEVVAAKKMSPTLSEKALVDMFRSKYGLQCNKSRIHRILEKHGLNGKAGGASAGPTDEAAEDAADAAGSDEEVRDAA